MSAKRKKKKAVLPCIITTELPRRSAYHSFFAPPWFQSPLPSVSHKKPLFVTSLSVYLFESRPSRLGAGRPDNFCEVPNFLRHCGVFHGGFVGDAAGSGERGARPLFSQKSGRAPQCGGCRFSQRKGQGPVRRENAVGQPCCTPQKRMSMAENSLRRALSCGERVPSSRPVTMPSPQAHWRAETAYSETEKASA